MKKTIPQHPQTICILRLSAIGDVCHTLAVVRAIQRQYPQADITWVIGQTEAMLMAGLENVRLVPYDKKSGWKGILSLWRQLRQCKFDVLLNMQTAFRASILSLGISAKCKLGFNDERAREGQRFFINAQIAAPQGHHVLDGQMMFAKAIGVKDVSLVWDLPLSERDFSAIVPFIDQTKPNLLIAPCSSKKEKDWAIEKYGEIARFALEKDANVILCGSSSQYEQTVTNAIQQLAPQCLNLVGKTTLKQLAALINKVDLVLSSDSGPAHIATTQGTPVIGLYAIHNPRRTGPYCDLDKVISVYDEAIVQQYGKSWEQLPWATKVKGSNLMDRISTETVKQKILQLLPL